MIKSDKKLKNLKAVLAKDDDLLIAEAIGMLREEEPFEGVISALADHFDSTSSEAVTRAISEFINDIKDPSLQPEVIAEIKKERKPATVTMLVSSCWQSGMDYSGFSRDFATIFFEGNLNTAVECYTVLEESIPQLDDREREEITGLINTRNIAETGTRKSLADELLSMLKKD